MHTDQIDNERLLYRAAPFCDELSALKNLEFIKLIFWKVYLKQNLTEYH